MSWEARSLRYSFRPLPCSSAFLHSGHILTRVSSPRPVDNCKIVFSAALPTSLLKILYAQVSLEDAGTIHVPDHRSDHVRALSEYRQFKISDRLIALHANGSYRNSRNSYVARQRSFQIRQ